MELLNRIIKKFERLKISKLNFASKGDNVEIMHGNEFQDVENIEIGDNVYIGPNGIYLGYGRIIIGNGTIIAHNVEIQTRNHNYDSDDLTAIPYDSKYIYKRVLIGDNVWIGSNVLILPGIEVGEGAVLGMGAVVTKDVPAYAVVGGNPAKILKYRNKETYEKLKKEDKIYLKVKNKEH